MNGLASSLAEIGALKGITGKTACDIVVCPPFTPIEQARASSSALKTA
jgi:triosephosphate isomerase